MSFLITILDDILSIQTQQQKRRLREILQGTWHRFLAREEAATRSFGPLPNERELRAKNWQNQSKSININMSTGEPTYRPNDSRNAPDLIAFCMTKDFGTKYSKTELFTNIYALILTNYLKDTNTNIL